jgi:hypothetical protein
MSSLSDTHTHTQEGLIREDYTLVDAVDKSDTLTNVNAIQHYLVVPLEYGRTS